MAIINFSIPKTLEQRVNQTIKEKGFASKAEFFRFAAISFIDSSINKQKIDEDKRFDYLAENLSNAIARRYKGKEIGSLEKQLAEL